MDYDYKITKYPRTPHLEGSRLQDGDYDLSQVPFSDILGKHVVVEEKVDGANCAISFDGDGNLLIQSRGHYLVGGYRERHYNLLKAWANANRDALWGALGNRYIMYGEWMYAKHTVFYDALPHYFLEFDVLDRQTESFLDTPSRKAITNQIGGVCSVPVLASGVFSKKQDVLKLLDKSCYITPNCRATLAQTAQSLGLNTETIIAETDLTGQMEGLYVKVEEAGVVTNRVKFVRANFLQANKAPTTDWQRRPIVPNQLATNTKKD